jgi:hypothetical protein
MSGGVLTPPQLLPAMQGSTSATQGSSSAWQESASAWQESASAWQESASFLLPGYELPCDTLDCAIGEIGRTQHALRALPALGITAKLGERFRCILPGHGPDDARSASIWRDPHTGLYKYRDWHHYQHGSDEWLRLCDVRAALSTGKVRWLRSGEAALWYLRLWFEARLIQPVPLELPALPTEANAGLIAVAEGFSLLVGLRRLTGDTKPTPFAYRFIGPWCGLPERSASRALRELVRGGVIACVGELPNGGMRPTLLYEPGVVR